MDGRSWRGPRHFHIVMSRILSPGYRLILCANKPFRPGVKLSVTPERSPTRSLFRRCRRRRCHRRRPTKGEERTSGKRYERVWKRSGLERALMAANWPEKRPGREPDRYKKKKRNLDEWYNRFLFTIVREKKTMEMILRRAPSLFRVASRATGYNRFDRPIRQIIGRRRVWNLISRALVHVLRAACFFPCERDWCLC